MTETNHDSKWSSKQKTSSLDLGISFEAFEQRHDRLTGKKTSYFTTGSFVGCVDGQKWVYEEQIDSNPHQPINKLHMQVSIRSAPEGDRPKKVRLKAIQDLDHTPLVDNDTSS